MIDINELRRLALDGDLCAVQEVIAHLERVEKERDDVAQQLVQAEIGKRKLDAECDALRAKIERMDEAMESLLIRCDDSDSAMYGTLSTSFVRDTVRIARAAPEKSK